jgi:hypothetical protein
MLPFQGAGKTKKQAINPTRRSLRSLALGWVRSLSGIGFQPVWGFQPAVLSPTVDSACLGLSARSAFADHWFSLFGAFSPQRQLSFLT